MMRHDINKTTGDPCCGLPLIGENGSRVEGEFCQNGFETGPNVTTDKAGQCPGMDGKWGRCCWFHKRLWNQGKKGQQRNFFIKEGWINGAPCKRYDLGSRGVKGDDFFGKKSREWNATWLRYLVKHGLPAIASLGPDPGGGAAPAPAPIQVPPTPEVVVDVSGDDDDDDDDDDDCSDGSETHDEDPPPAPHPDSRILKSDIQRLTRVVKEYQEEAEQRKEEAEKAEAVLKRELDEARCSRDEARRQLDEARRPFLPPPPPAPGGVLVPPRPDPLVAALRVQLERLGGVKAALEKENLELKAKSGRATFYTARNRGLETGFRAAERTVGSLQAHLRKVEVEMEILRVEECNAQQYDDACIESSFDSPPRRGDAARGDREHGDGQGEPDRASRSHTGHRGRPAVPTTDADGRPAHLSPMRVDNRSPIRKLPFVGGEGSGSGPEAEQEAELPQSGSGPEAEQEAELPQGPAIKTIKTIKAATIKAETIETIFCKEIEGMESKIHGTGGMESARQVAGRRMDNLVASIRRLRDDLQETRNDLLASEHATSKAEAENRKLERLLEREVDKVRELKLNAGGRESSRLVRGLEIALANAQEQVGTLSARLRRPGPGGQDAPSDLEQAVRLPPPPEGGHRYPRYLPPRPRDVPMRTGFYYHGGTHCLSLPPYTPPPPPKPLGQVSRRLPAGYPPLRPAMAERRTEPFPMCRTWPQLPNLLSPREGGGEWVDPEPISDLAMASITYPPAQAGKDQNLAPFWTGVVSRTENLCKGKHLYLANRQPCAGWDDWARNRCPPQPYPEDCRTTLPPKWKAFILSAQPRCGFCECELSAVTHDHEFDHRDGNRSNGARDNTWILCVPCHAAKTATEAGWRLFRFGPLPCDAWMDLVIFSGSCYIFSQSAAVRRWEKCRSAAIEAAAARRRKPQVREPAPGPQP